MTKGEFCVWVEFDDATEDVFMFKNVKELKGKQLSDAKIGDTVQVTPPKSALREGEKKGVIWIGKIIKASGKTRKFLLIYSKIFNNVII